MKHSLPNHVNVQEAKNGLSRLLARAHAGEEIIICMAGIPFARLVGIAPAAERELGFLSDQFSADEMTAMNQALLEGASDEELAAWYDLPVVHQFEPETGKAS